MAGSEVITIVFGMHRSGTSLCSHILSLLGIDMADEVTRRHGNWKGHWERWEIVAFHDRILELLGRGYLSPHHAEALPGGWWADPAVRSIRDEIAAWTKDRKRAALRFGFKDPRASRLLPLWNEILERHGWIPRYVYCVRDPDQVARSLSDRDGAFSQASAAEHRWLAYNAGAVRGVGSAPVCIIPYDSWFSDQSATLKRLHSFVLGDVPLAWEAEQAVAEAVDPESRHDRPSETRAGPAARNLYRAVLGSVELGRFSDDALSAARHIGALEPMLSTMHAAGVAAQAAQAAYEDSEARGRALAAEHAMLAAERDSLATGLDAERRRAEALKVGLIQARDRADEITRQLEEARSEMLRLTRENAMRLEAERGQVPVAAPVLEPAQEVGAVDDEAALEPKQADAA